MERRLLQTVGMGPRPWMSGATDSPRRSSVPGRRAPYPRGWGCVQPGPCARVEAVALHGRSSGLPEKPPALTVRWATDGPTVPADAPAHRCRLLAPAPRVLGLR